MRGEDICCEADFDWRPLHVSPRVRTREAERWTQINHPGDEISIEDNHLFFFFPPPIVVLCEWTFCWGSRVSGAFLETLKYTCAIFRYDARFIHDSCAISIHYTFKPANSDKLYVNSLLFIKVWLTVIKTFDFRQVIRTKTFSDKHLSKADAIIRSTQIYKAYALGEYESV